MHYNNMVPGIFLARPNRFIAQVEIAGEVQTVHVKNTGRLRELLFPGALCWLDRSGNPSRKTLYDLVAVEKDGRVVNIDSQCPNLIARGWVEQGGWDAAATEVRAEFVHGDSRFDLTYMKGGVRGLIEVKGVTLFDEAGVAIFPDAPTSRGAKHLRGLIQAKHAGMEAGVIFVIMKEDAVALRPNDATDPDFAAALREAHAAGVRIVAACCRVTADSAEIVRTVPVIL